MQLVLMDLLGHLVHLVLMGLQVIEVFLVCQVLQDLLALGVHLDLKEKEEMLVLLAKRDLLDHLVLRVHQDLLELEEKGVKRVHLVNKELLVWEVDLETKVHQVLQVQLDLLVLLDFL